jgi:YfiH family protein
MSLPLVLKKADGFYNISLLEAAGFRAFFTTRRFDMAFEPVCRGRRFLRKDAYQKIGLDASRLVSPLQVHGDSIRIVGPKDRGKGAYERLTAVQETDALMTNEPHLPIAILTADCLPVFMADTNKRAICLVHAGWKGVHKKIVVKAIRQMVATFQTALSDLTVVLGPALRPCCYEVGRAFTNLFPEATVLRGDRFYFDMAAAVAGQLLKCGVTNSQVYDTHLCTSCLNQEFFSYRREGEDAGRSMSVLEIA